MNLPPVIQLLGALEIDRDIGSRSRWRAMRIATFNRYAVVRLLIRKRNQSRKPGIADAVFG